MTERTHLERLLLAPGPAVLLQMQQVAKAEPKVHIDRIWLPTPQKCP